MTLIDQYKCRLLVVFFFITTDLVLTTVLIGHWTDLEIHILQDVYNYSYAMSLFDLWIFSLFRFYTITDALIGLWRNGYHGPKRIKDINKHILVAAVFMWSYSIVKMLVHYEYMASLKKPWFWSLFVWSNMAVLIYYIIWSSICSIKADHLTCDQKTLHANSPESDRQPIMTDEVNQESYNTKDANITDNKSDKSDDKPKASKGSVVWRLLSLSFPDWPYLCLAFTFLIISATCNSKVFLPFVTGQVIDGITIEKSSAKFTQAILLMASLSVLSSIASGLRSGFFRITIARLNNRICDRLFSSLVQQEVGFYDVTSTGEITSCLTADTTKMGSTLGLNFNVFLRSTIEVIGISVFMFKLSWQLSMVTVVGLPIYMIVSNVYGNFIKDFSKEVQNSVARSNEVAQETVSTIRTVRSFANEMSEVFRFRGKLANTYKIKKKRALYNTGYMWCTEFLLLSLAVAILYYGGHLVVNKSITGGHLVSFILYQMELHNKLESITDKYTSLMEVVGSSEKVFEFTDRKPAVNQDQGKLAPLVFNGKIEFKNVSFSYPSRPDTVVLKDLSFSVEPGEVVALVGPSGAGKSTCVGLIKCFYERGSGQVLLDNTPIQLYDHKYLHKKISLVGQEPVLYARSIKENIAYGMDEATDNMIEQAATMANAHQFISEMKDKYETKAGEKGMQLSGGQKQRVAIARALIRNPSILLLDEATSALDSESEDIVQEAMYKNMSGRTVIIIAHRLSTVKRADRIIVIHKGQMVEQGSHKDLLTRDGMYAQLVRHQMNNPFDFPNLLQMPSKSTSMHQTPHLKKLRNSDV